MLKEKIWKDIHLREAVGFLTHCTTAGISQSSLNSIGITPSILQLRRQASRELTTLSPQIIKLILYHSLKKVFLMAPVSTLTNFNT